MKSRKAMGPVVASALLLVVAVVGIVGFQSWYETFQSTKLVDINSQSTEGIFSTKVENINEDLLYFNNGYNENITVSSIRIGGLDCNIDSLNLSPGINNIWVGDCLNSISTKGSQDVLVLTDKGTFNQKYSIKPVTLKPSLSLNFDLIENSLDWPSQVTFERGSVATYLGSDGLIRNAPHNLFYRSEEFDNAIWLNIGSPNITADYALAPDGTLSADRIEFGPTANDQIFQLFSSINQSIYTGSFYVKSTPGSGTTHVRLKYYDGTSDYNSVDISINENSWTRISQNFTAQVSTNLNFALRNPVAGSADILIWGAQLEKNPSSSLYLKTIASQNFDGPRIEYDMSGNVKGLLIEESRTNYNFYSEKFLTDFNYAANSDIISSNELSPMGLLNAVELNMSNPGGVGNFGIGGLRYPTSDEFTASIFVKTTTHPIVSLWIDSGAGNGAVVQFDLDNNLSQITRENVGNTVQRYGIIDYPNNWKRIYLSTNLSSSTTKQMRAYFAEDGFGDNDDGFGTAQTTLDGDSEVYLFGSQLELGLFPTSYIPTDGASVTRNADDVYLSNLSWFDVNKGTFISTHTPVNGVTQVASNDPTVYSMNSGSWNERLTLSIYANSVSVVAGTPISSFTGITSPLDLERKVAFVYNNNDYAYSINGNSTKIDTSGGVPTGFTEMRIGRHDRQPTLHSNVQIKKILYYPNRLSNSKIELMTK